MKKLVAICLILLVALAVLWREPTFCKYLCPAGLLEAGLPLTSLNPQLAGMRGPLFYVELAILLAIVLLSLVIFRPFCKYLCPLGAFYGLFNGVGFYRLQVAEDKCVRCGQCQRACPMDVDVVKTPNSPECIRYGKCVDTCPTKAISVCRSLKASPD